MSTAHPTIATQFCRRTANKKRCKGFADKRVQSETTRSTRLDSLDSIHSKSLQRTTKTQIFEYYCDYCSIFSCTYFVNLHSFQRRTRTIFSHISYRIVLHPHVDCYNITYDCFEEDCNFPVVALHFSFLVSSQCVFDYHVRV